METPELYMFTMAFSLSARRASFTRFSFPFRFMSIRFSERRMDVASAERLPIVFRISACVVSGKRMLPESIASWMLTTRTPTSLQRSRNAPSSRMPRSALLNLLTTMVSPDWSPASMRLHSGRSFSCEPLSSMMLSHPKSFIHWMSSSRAEYPFARNR